MAEEAVKQEDSRNPDGTFKPGISGNPNGRPKGKTMKEFAREWLLSMTDEQKLEWLSKQAPETIWRMAEGNPHQTSDMTSAGKPIPILGHALPTNDSNKESSEPKETN